MPSSTLTEGSSSPVFTKWTVPFPALSHGILGSHVHGQALRHALSHSSIHVGMMPVNLFLARADG